MAESLAHMTYVRKIVSYIEDEFADKQKNLIMADLPEYGGRTPQVIGGFYPDVYFRTLGVIAIGEAKTDDDIDRQHTDDQIQSYIKEARTATFHTKHIVLATSVFAFAMWKNKIVRMKKTGLYDDITFHILDNIKRKAII